MKIVNDDFYLNQTESCALIGVSLGTFRALKADPDFPKSITLLRRPMWRASDIKAWCKSRVSLPTGSVSDQVGKAA